jgi:dTDP-4-dehydrorhamnose reductase
MRNSHSRKVLVIRCTGQVAQALAHVGTGPLVNVGRPDVDLRDADSLSGAIERHAPDIVINAGGFTKVDQAETEPDAAFVLNVDGPRALAVACARKGIPLVHLSTDCVFDGTLSRPYGPSDPPAPLSTYGRSKLAGEYAVADAAAQHLIVRVSWVFSHLAGNFVRTMLTLAQTREAVTVVCDQTGCPTHAPALATALLAIADTACTTGFSDWGTYHLAGSGETDRASFARHIFELSRQHDGPAASVTGALTADFPTLATRPLNARLDMTRTTDIFGVTLPEWQAGMADAVPILVRELEGG